MPPDPFARFPEIGLSDIAQAALLDRIDNKYPMAEAQLPGFLAALAHEYAVLRIEGRARLRYRTLYFDTHDRDCYLKHQNRRLPRHKIRIRTYLDTDTHFLEIKHKNNRGKTFKRRIEIDQFDPQAPTRHSDFVAEHLPIAPRYLRPALEGLFERATLVRRDFKERITVDRNLSFHHADRHAEPNGLVVVERKFDRASLTSPAATALRNLRVFPAGLSKYCLGSALTVPGLKGNRMKRKLHRLRRVLNQELRSAA